MKITAPEIAKALAALITTLVAAAGEAITLGLAHGDAAKWITIAIGCATPILAYLAVYLTPNAPPAAVVPPVPPVVVPPAV